MKTEHAGCLAAVEAAKAKDSAAAHKTATAGDLSILNPAPFTLSPASLLMHTLASMHEGVPTSFSVPGALYSSRRAQERVRVCPPCARPLLARTHMQGKHTAHCPSLPPHPSSLWLPAAHTLYERRQLDLCVGRAAPVTPHHGATGSSCGKPSKRCAAASGPRTHALSALSCALTRCGASLCGHRYLYVSCRARSRPRPDRPRHGHRRRCRRRRRRRRHSPRVRLMRLCSSRHYLRVRTCDGHVV